MANSPEDLIDKVQDYLECPWMDSEGRHTTVTKLCGFTDGRSGERVAHAILGVLDLVANPQKQPQNFGGDT